MQKYTQQHFRIVVFEDGGKWYRSTKWGKSVEDKQTNKYIHE